MKRPIYFAAIGALIVSYDALAVGGIAQVSVIDRRSGVELTPHLYHGEYWVAGTPGTHYAIEIRNKLGERILAVTSVDGVNVISGATAGWNQAGYVFGAGEDYEITGWRKSDAEVAAFTFTASPDSYAARTGRSGNIGVIGVALFRERQAEREPVPSVTASPAEKDALAAPAAAPKLGTGHGEREASYVNHTEFARMQPQPNEVIRIRYDSLENLLSLGIIERPHTAPPAGDPFPASVQDHYVPDPPSANRGKLQ